MSDIPKDFTIKLKQTSVMLKVAYASAFWVSNNASTCYIADKYYWKDDCLHSISRVQQTI